jgi:archaellum biogenesis protein FlaJ (TadC family)
MITFFLNLYDTINSFLNSVDFSRTILTLKLISYAISFFFIFLIAVLLKKSEATWWLKEGARARQAAYGPQKLDKKWQTVLMRLKKGDEASLKLAIIEADNIFDDILKRMGLPGIDMGERLRQFEPHELKSVELVWEAHRLRNAIVHEPTIEISQAQAEQAVQGYEAALKELEYL